MNHRPTASTITDAQLDELYDFIRHLTSAVAFAYGFTPDEVLATMRQSITAERAARRAK